MTSEQIELKNELFEHIEYLRNYAAKVMNYSADSEDVVQEALVKILAKSHLYKGGSVKAWARAIVRNACIDFLKPQYRGTIRYVGSYYDIALMPEPPQSNEDERLEKMHKAISELKESHQIVFRFLLNGYSYLEIADELEVNMNNVKAKVSRAKKALRKKLLIE